MRRRSITAALRDKLRRTRERSSGPLSNGSPITCDPRESDDIQSESRSGWGQNREDEGTMSQFVHIASQPTLPRVNAPEPFRRSSTVLWLQGITLIWMLVECGAALFAAAAAHSPAIFAFGSDSLIELISAIVVLLQFLPQFSISEKRASRATSVLLFALAVVVTAIAVFALVLHSSPQASTLGMGITVAAIVAMAVLAWLKRREARRSGNSALGADAVQSATCAYLAAITLIGLVVNATFHIAWFDSAAAIAASLSTWMKVRSPSPLGSAIFARHSSTSWRGAPTRSAAPKVGCALCWTPTT